MTTFNEIINVLPESTLLKLKNVEYLKGILESHYQYPWRHYHNLDHILDMLQKLKFNTFNVTESRDELAVAILFHDAVYNLRAASKENETASAELAWRFGLNCFDDVNWVIVYDLIMATTHTDDLSEKSVLIKTIADLDLSTFNLPYEDFSRLGDEIIKEYLTLYTYEQVIPGRMAFLQKFSERPVIFYTEGWSNERAFENIKLELDKLGRLHTENNG